MNRSRKLSAEDIAPKLAALPHWQVQGEALVRECRFHSYLAGVDFIVAVAKTAEAMNHHPDLHLGWRRVGITLTTHDARGLTELDFALAAQIESLFAPSKT